MLLVSFAVNRFSPCHCGCPPGQAEDVSNGRLQKKQVVKDDSFFIIKQVINCPKILNLQVIFYHKDAPRCCTSVAAADWFTCRLVVERLTASEYWIVVKCMHQVRVHIPKEKTNLRWMKERKDRYSEGKTSGKQRHTQWFNINLILLVSFFSI